MTEEFYPESEPNEELAPHAPDYGDDETYKKATWKNSKAVEIDSPQTVFSAQPSQPPPSPPSLTHQSAARERVRRRRVSKNRGGEWAWVIIAVAMLGVVLTISMSVFFWLRSSEDEPEIIPTAVSDLSALPTPANFRSDAAGGAGGEEITLVDGSSIVLEPWDGQSRFTVLVMGLDRRPGETGLSYRTDTMMLASIDPQTQSLGILSIPRDLYVSVPGYNQLQRINTPMFLGEIQSPGYGPQLAMETVQYNLGIRVHDYLAVDFQAFIDLVDAIGGVQITTDYTINDPQYPSMNYGYDPFYLAAGTHQLSGYDALRFARTRHGDNDFERANRQQQVIFAVRNRILDLNILPSLIIEAPRLLSSWEDNVYTGLDLDQIIQLAWYLKDVPSENISTGVIDYNYTQNYRTGDGADVLIPNRDRLGTLMVDVFGSNYSQ